MSNDVIEQPQTTRKYTEKDILSFTEKECLEKCVMHYTMKHT